MPEGIRVLEAVGRKFELSFRWDHFPWSCEYYLAEGRMMPEDGLARIRNHGPLASRAFQTTSPSGVC